MPEAAEAVAVEVFNNGGDAPEAPAVETEAPETAEKPVKGKAAKEEAAPAEGDDYEHPSLKELFGGKAKTFKAADEIYANSSKEARRLAKEAEELGGKWKSVEAIVGAPVDDKGEPAPYDFGFPPEADVDKVLVGLAENTLREMNLSNGAAQKLGTVLANYEAQRELGRREYERGRAIEALGAGNEEVASAAAAKAFQWAGKLLADDPAAIEDLKECGGVGAAINTIARLQRAATGISMGRSMGAGAGLDKAGYEAIVSQNGWFNDAAKSAQVEEYLNRLAPGGEPKEQDS